MKRPPSDVVLMLTGVCVMVAVLVLTFAWLSGTILWGVFQ